MNWWQLCLVFAAAYLLIGGVSAAVLKETPYALNPQWTMILLWWDYFPGIGVLFAAIFASAMIWHALG